jgi:WD repeat-containing protein 35
VDGNRLWGKELKHTLAFVQWSPDGRYILFGTVEGEVFIYDNLGNKITPMTLYAVDGSERVQIIGMHWYDGTEGYTDPSAPTLAVAFENGRVQITRGEYDDKPVLIDTGMRLTQCKWNTNGSVLALSGTQRTKLSTGDSRDVSLVQFYTPLGTHLRTLKVPGSGIGALSWEGGGLRIALAVESYIYFANIRPDYKWGYFANTLAYAFSKPDRAEHCIIFWDTHTDDRYVKYVKNLIAIKAAGENCVLATKSDDTSGQYILILCNAIGSPIDSKYVDVNPLYITMTKYHVVVASDTSVYCWQYRTPVSKLTSLDADGPSLRRREGREVMFHIDDAPDTSSLARIEGKTGADLHKEFARQNQGTSDAICCVAASEHMFVVGRESGTIQRYSLPHIALEHTYIVRCRPQLLAINCDSTRMSIIDINGILTLFDLDGENDGDGDGGGGGATGNTRGKHLSYERKDTWDMVWAEDNPELFAMMEKTRMYIFRGLQPEEPVLSSGYLCQFKELQIKAIMLDEIMQNPDHPAKEHVLDFETKSLRDARELLDVGVHDAFQFIEQHPHPRLWRLLAEAALEQLEFQLAEKAFVACQDYQGIQFVMKLQVLDDKAKQRAEVAAYFQRFDEAEQLYRDIDRKDLAIELRMRLGDWFRVVHLVQSGGGNDELLAVAYNKIGDYYADRQKWSKAVKSYKEANNLEALVTCYYTVEDFAGLDEVINALPEGSRLLQDVGEKFQSVGMCNSAVSAFLKLGDVKAAIDCCVLLNQWDQAVELAEQNDFPQIEGLLSKYGSHLLEKGKKLQAIELYRKANKSPEAAKLLCGMAQEVLRARTNPMRAKRLYVLAALEMERFKKRTLTVDAFTTSNMTQAQTTAATLDNLMTHDAATGGNKALDKAWHGAEACHFWLLAHRHLYDGQTDLALKVRLTANAANG